MAFSQERPTKTTHHIPTERRLFAYHQAGGYDYSALSFVAKPVMTLNPESKYPNRRAYVLKIRGDAKRDALVGRIENLVTGQQREFTSGHELLESIAGDLEAIVSERSVDADRN